MAIVCCDDVYAKESDLFEEFTCVCSDSCKIPEHINKGGELWKEGRYWYSKQVDQEGILGVFQAIIECLEKLNKDMRSANQIFDGMCRLTEDLYLQKGVISMLSGALFTPDDQRSKHANVCALVFLPQAFFDIFSREEYYFLPMIKYIIKGVDGEEYLKGELRRKEEIIQRLTEEKKVDHDKYERLEKEHEIVTEDQFKNEKFLNLLYENAPVKNAILADDQIKDFLVTGNITSGCLQKWQEELKAKMNARYGDVKCAKEAASKESDTSSIDAYDKEYSAIKDSGERDDR